MAITNPAQDPPNAPDFVFVGYGFDWDLGILTLTYRFDGGPDFIETIRFPTPTQVDGARKVAADQAFALIFWLAGVSYYKAYAAGVRIPPSPPSEQLGVFLQTVYTKGLAEFAYENGIDIRARVHIAGQGAPAPAPILGLKDRALVPVGGGKDSIVSLEALKAADKDVTLFVLGGASGPAQPIAETIRVSGLPHIFVERTLSPELKKLNDAGALNGHVPITAILSAIASTCAVLYDFRDVVLSNEHSASAPNIVDADWDINHQYSKSLEFERDFSEILQSQVAADLRYFSLLRPLTEAAIAKRFADHTAYHGIFRSCNTAFKQDVSARGKRWCNDCPKCRFVFLALAPFMRKDRLVEVFGADPLNEVSQTLGYQQLCGLADYKPFECVGEVSESKLLMEALSHDPTWASDANVIICAENSPAFAQKFAALFEMKPDHLVPPDYMQAIL